MNAHSSGKHKEGLFEVVVFKMLLMAVYIYISNLSNIFLENIAFTVLEQCLCVSKYIFK